MQFPHTDARWRCLRSEIRNTLFEPHSCRITSESVNMASAALVRLLRLSAVRNGRLSPRRPFNAPGRTVTPSRKAVCTSSGAILPKPKKTPFGLFRIALVVVPFLYVGTQISKSFAALLEEHDIFVPEDDDDDD
ncbi:essential MCU regulator, mitochondrial-like [Girardinichthys multiradiatus]|uniref:essential MCU regulator, mitochondrial-like n=1 Tax=Girardinichthys multiradiatus TaxID=208333 RepID=UPI001FAC2D26|nr:essential MCU regulator, mitochondrial-like isoform X2 [Girardinichthys multiradiatus]XP_047214225.1 essential MCU regulator, mitochondrial-like [Girardinichthys multiradiatus]